MISHEVSLKNQWEYPHARRRDTSQKYISVNLWYRYQDVFDSPHEAQSCSHIHHQK